MEALKLAREMIKDEGHWTKGTDYRSPVKGDGPFCGDWFVCARGAVRAVTLGLKKTSLVTGECLFSVTSAKTPEDAHLYNATMAFLNNAAQQRGFAGTVDMNDVSGTTHEDVLGMFDDAISLARIKRSQADLYT